MSEAGSKRQKPADNSAAAQPAAATDRRTADNGWQQQKLVIYTARDKNIFEIVLPKFKEKYPDVEVETLEMGAQQILERVRAEKANPQADFWWGGTQSALITAADEGLLETYKPTFADKIPDLYKDTQDRWYGEMLLPEVIMYNPQALKKEDAPKDWDELLDPKYKGQNRDPRRTAFRHDENHLLRHDLSPRPDTPEKGYEWLKKLDANTKEYTQDPTNLYLKLDRQEGAHFPLEPAGYPDPKQKEKPSVMTSSIRQAEPRFSLTA